jgi:hypothetical protein
MTHYEPTFLLIREKYDAVATQIGLDFKRALDSKVPSTLVQRAERVQKVMDAISECSVELTRYMLSGMTDVYDFASALYDRWNAHTLQYLQESRPAGMSVKYEFERIENTVAAAHDIRRLCAEAGVTFQNLELHPQITLAGGTVREATCRLAAESGQWQKLRPALAQIVIETLVWERGEEVKADRDAALMASRRKLMFQTVDFLLRLTLPEQRAACLETWLITPYLSRLDTDIRRISGEWTVKHLLDEGADAMRRELERATAVLAPYAETIVQRAKSTLQQAMFVSNASRIAEHEEWGAAAALRYPIRRQSEFANLVLLLDFDPAAFKALVTAVEKTVAAAFETRIAREGGNPIRCLRDLVLMTGEYTAAVTVPQTSETNNLSFCIAAQCGALRGLPLDGSVEEAFVALVDEILKEKKESGAPDTRGLRLAALMGGFNLLRDVNLFVMLYKRQLAVRLLLRPHVSVTLERTTLDAIEVHLGLAAVKHLRVMLDDVGGGGAAAGATMPWCNGYVWPTAPAAFRGATFAAPLQAAFADAVSAKATADKALSRPPKRSYAIDPHLTRCELNLRSGDVTCHIMCSASQANVLLRVKREPTSLSDLAAATGLGIDDLKFVLSSMQSSGLITHTGETVAFDLSFGHGDHVRRKIVLPSLVVVKRAPTLLAEGESSVIPGAAVGIDIGAKSNDDDKDSDEAEEAAGGGIASTMRDTFRRAKGALAKKVGSVRVRSRR